MMNSAGPVTGPVRSAGPPGGGADPVTSLFRAHGVGAERVPLGTPGPAPGPADETMLIVDAPRPGPGQVVPEWFGLPDAGEWIPPDVLDELR